jgi:hypothetical protein
MKNSLRSMTLTLAFALLLVCTSAGAVLAQGTPDHMPPALETVCDMEQGAAYGHCNAYCEAMDCELANDNDPSTQPHASANACAKVRAKFQQTTGRDVPCEVTCPCAEIEGTIADVLAGQIPIDGCSRSLNGFGGLFLFTPALPNGPIAFSGSGEGFSICGYVGEVEVGNVLPITAEQDQECRQLLEQYATSKGLTCTP